MTYIFGLNMRCQYPVLSFEVKSTFSSKTFVRLCESEISRHDTEGSAICVPECLNTPGGLKHN